MRLWRIYDHRARWAREADFDPLDGRGGLFAEGRWHTLGTRVVYIAASPSLAVLETLVRVDPTLFGERSLLELDVPETSIERVSEQALLQLLCNAPESELEHEMQRFGTRWVRDMRSLVLEVPSMVMPLERNYLLNPLHPEMKAVTMIRRELVTLDPRLYAKRQRGG